MKRIGPYISKLLRHDPENLNMDENGWVNVSELLNKVNITKSELDEIVNTNDKKRFSYNEDEKYIRARQGHSLNNIDLGFISKEPPLYLYHGTSNKSVNSILNNGIEHKNRQYVHLSDNINTAINVGKRHGIPIVFIINSAQMYNDKFDFFLSDNGVWLTKYVPSKYLIIKK